jgi:2-methylcitrate dehydratase PrpD
MTVALADFAAKTSYSDLPASAIEKMKIYALDVLASGFVCARLPWARVVHEVVSEQGGKAESSVFGATHKVTASQAALVNGVMVGGFEAEHIGHVSHPAGTVTPAALAIAERQHASGRDFLLATALGYEVVCRIGEGQTAKTETVRGFHNPAVNGPFSAATAVGKLLGFDGNTMANALGIAGSYSSGLTQYAFDGSMTKRLHLGHSSQGGLEAALLAAKGFTGPHAVLEGEYGFYNAFSPGPNLDKVLENLGDEWFLETLRIKAFASHATSQAIIAALQEFSREQSVDLSQVSRLHVRGSAHWSAATRFWDREPNSLMGAQYSLPYSIAVALVRDLNDPLAFDESALIDERVRTVAREATYEEIEPGHHNEYSELDLTIGGVDYRVECGPYRGSLLNPATFEDLVSKFERFSRHLLDEKQQHEIVEIVSRLEDLDDISVLADAIRG